MNSGIYIIRNVINGRVYIGASDRIAQRICNHISALNRGQGATVQLQTDWNRYGSESFVCDVLIHATPELKFRVERSCINLAVLTFGQASVYNRPFATHSTSTRKKIGERNGLTYPGFISPDGTTHPPIQNLARFCRENRLSYTRMHNLTSGKESWYNGWRYAKMTPVGLEPTA